MNVCTHCKNRRVVFTQLVLPQLHFKDHKQLSVFACKQFKFQKQPSCFCSACTKLEDCFWSLNCNYDKQAGLKQPSCFCSELPGTLNFCLHWNSISRMVDLESFECTTPTPIGLTSWVMQISPCSKLPYIVSLYKPSSNRLFVFYDHKRNWEGPGNKQWTTDCLIAIQKLKTITELCEMRKSSCCCWYTQHC